MRKKVSNYIAEFLVEHGITQVFTVTGGGAMHLNDALGHQEGLHCLYQHQELTSLKRHTGSYGSLRIILRLEITRYIKIGKQTLPRCLKALFCCG